MHARRIVVLLSLALAPQLRAQAPAWPYPRDSTKLLFPEKFDDWRRISRTHPGTGDDVVLTYTGPESLTVKVSVSAGPDFAKGCAAACVTARLARESDTVAASLTALGASQQWKGTKVDAKERLTPNSRFARWQHAFHASFTATTDDGPRRGDYYVALVPGNTIRLVTTYRATAARSEAMDRFVQDLLEKTMLASTSEFMQVSVPRSTFVEFAAWKPRFEAPSGDAACGRYAPPGVPNVVNLLGRPTADPATTLVMNWGYRRQVTVSWDEAGELFTYSDSRSTLNRDPAQDGSTRISLLFKRGAYATAQNEGKGLPNEYTSGESWQFWNAESMGNPERTIGELVKKCNTTGAALKLRP